MAPILGTLTTTQKQLLTVGAPAAVVLGIGAAVRRNRREEAEKAADPNPPAPAAGYTLPYMPSTDAIGVGQLADFESAITRQVNDLYEHIERKNATPPPPATPPPVARPILVRTPIPRPATAPGPPPPPAPAPAPPAQAPVRTYTVVRGDSLWAISARFYGNGSRWPVIYDRNRAVIGGNPNLIRPGQVLVIP